MNTNANTSVNTSVNTNANTNVFLGNENKALLWSVLHGGGKFNGIPDIQFKNIQIMFETTIREMGESYRKSNQHADLNGMNKEAVVTICKKMEMIKSGHKQMQPASQVQVQAQAQYQKKQQQPPQLQTIYKAEDIQKERQTAFNMELKKKEEEMASIITLRKPDEIKFTDDVYDRPIGDDMERLLAEALASRERELEQLTHVITATTTVTALDSNPLQQPQQPNSFNKDKGGDKEKHVSFGRVIEHDYANNNNNNNDDNFLNEDGLNNSINDADVDADLTSLFNKFKKINNDKKNVIDDDATNIIIKMSQDILDIKSILTELSERINKFNQ